MVCPISDLRIRQREAEGLGESSWAGEIVRASSRPGPLFPSKLTFEKWFYRFWILGNGLSCVYACARARVCMRMRMCGGGRVYIGVYACLRFERVFNLPLGAREGGFQGRLFAGRVMMAE